MAKQQNSTTTNRQNFIEYEITPAGGDAEVKGAKLTLLLRSVSENAAVRLSLTVTGSKAPDGHVRASATLTCDPPIKSKKHIRIQLPTWYTTDASLDLGIFEERPDSKLKEIDSVVLTDERFIDLQVKELSNITAYLPKSHLQDVKVAVKPFVYHNTHGKVATGFKLSDKVFQDELAEKLEENRFWSLTDRIEEATVSIRDTLEYCLHSTDTAPSGKKPDEVKGQVMVDEEFLQNIDGHVSFCDLKSTPFRAVYDLRHLQSQGDQEVVVNESNYQILWRAAGAECGRIGVDFLGTVDAENIITNAADVEIDQRTIIDSTDGHNKKQQNDNVSYLKKSVQVGSVPRSVPVPPMSFKIGNGGGGRSQVTFHGHVKVKNVIGNATNVRIDQRKIHRKPGGGDAGPQPPKRPVQAEEDVPFPTEVADGVLEDHSFETRQLVEGKSESSRTFATTDNDGKNTDATDDATTMEVTTIHEN